MNPRKTMVTTTVAIVMLFVAVVLVGLDRGESPSPKNNNTDKRQQHSEQEVGSVQAVVDPFAPPLSTPPPTATEGVSNQVVDPFAPPK